MLWTIFSRLVSSNTFCIDSMTGPFSTFQHSKTNSAKSLFIAPSELQIRGGIEDN